MGLAAQCVRNPSEKATTIPTTVMVPLRKMISMRSSFSGSGSVIACPPDQCGSPTLDWPPVPLYRLQKSNARGTNRALPQPFSSLAAWIILVSKPAVKQSAVMPDISVGLPPRAGWCPGAELLAQPGGLNRSESRHALSGSCYPKRSNLQGRPFIFFAGAKISISGLAGPRLSRCEEKGETSRCR